MESALKAEDLYKCFYLRTSQVLLTKTEFRNLVQSHLGNIRLLPSLQPPRCRPYCSPHSSHSPKFIHFPLPSTPVPASFQLSLAPAASGCEAAAHLISTVQVQNKTPLSSSPRSYR